jgi:acyl-CoA synthetase (NDP forming)
MVSGGAAALVCDTAERFGLQLARWSEATIVGLRELLPSYAVATNPLDLTGGTMLHNREAVERAVRLIAEDPGTDMLSFVFPLHPEGGSEGMRKVVGVIAELASSLAKPIAIVSTNGGAVTRHWAEFSTQSHCAFMEDVDTAFAAMAQWARPAR